MKHTISLIRRRHLLLFTMLGCSLALLFFSFADLNASADNGHEMHTRDHAVQAYLDQNGATPASAAEDHSRHMQAISTMQGKSYVRSIAAYAVPQLELVDMHGAPVSIDALLNTDRPLLVNFIFTSCTTICPIMSATFAQAQKQLGEEAKPVDWISISIDPEYDTPTRLRDYAERFHAGENWQFITGDLERIIRLQKAFDVYRGSKMNHQPVTLMRAGRDQPWLRLEGLTSGAELVAEYRQLVH